MRPRRAPGAVAAAAALLSFAAAPATAASAQCAAVPAYASGSGSGGTLWALRWTDPQRVWALTQGAGVTVAVVDGGVDGSAAQLSGAVLTGADTVHSGPGDVDCSGSGTFAAGLIAARPAAGVGFVGEAPAATILPVRQNETGDDGSAATTAAAITYAVEAGARVIVVTAAATGPDPRLLAAVRFAAAYDVLVVAGAGPAADGSGPGYPAAYPGVLAVAAIGPGGTPAATAEPGGRVDLTAPGTGLTGPGDSGLVSGGGDGFAAAMVAGVAALVRSYRPRLTAAQVEQRLLETADRPAAALPDPVAGYGSVNLYAAVTAGLPGEGATSGAAAMAGGSTAGPAPVPVPAAVAAPVHRPAATALLVSVAVLLAASAAAAAALLPRARRRAWRPAGHDPLPETGCSVPAPAVSSTGPVGSNASSSEGTSAGATRA
jgi:type VII secretion-associated serine protease mycosin